MATVRAACGGANSKAALGKVKAIAHRATDAVVWPPTNQRGINPTLQDQILQEPAHRVVCQSCGDCRAQTKTSAQPASHIVFPAAFRRPKVPSGVDPLLARVKSQHHFTEAYAIPAVIFNGFYCQRFHL